MDSTQNVPASEKSAVPSCEPLVGTLVKLGSSWAVHGLKIGRTAVQMSAETLGKTVQTLDTLVAALERKAEKGPVAPEAPTPAAEASAPAGPAA
jgi:hypothetical protein